MIVKTPLGGEGLGSPAGSPDSGYGGSRTHDAPEAEDHHFEVCAVVVTYHPTWEMQQHLVGLIGQFFRVLVVDNGSSEGELEAIRKLAAAGRLALIENGENLGIAEALNQGVLFAKEQGFLWVMFLDQDSQITDHFVEDMCRTWSSDSHCDLIAAVHPRYIDPVTGAEPLFRRDRHGELYTSLTSGCLMPLWVFGKIGLFAADYFIDVVDIEYGLRIRAAGLRSVESKHAILLHSAGKPQTHRLFGIVPFISGHHSVLRRYYISRNRIALLRSYWRRFPYWTAVTTLESLKETAKCLVGESDRRAKLRSIWVGIQDGFSGKMGKNSHL